MPVAQLQIVHRVHEIRVVAYIVYALLRSVGQIVGAVVADAALVVATVAESVVNTELRLLVVIFKVSAAVVESRGKGLHRACSAHVARAAPLHHIVDHGLQSAVRVSYSGVVDIFYAHHLVGSERHDVLRAGHDVVDAHLHRAALHARHGLHHGVYPYAVERHEV